MNAEDLCGALPTGLPELLGHLTIAPEPGETDSCVLFGHLVGAGNERLSVVVGGVRLEIDREDVLDVTRYSPDKGAVDDGGGLGVRLQLTSPAHLFDVQRVPDAVTYGKSLRRPFAFSARTSIADSGDGSRYRELEEAYLRRYGLSSGPR